MEVLWFKRGEAAEKRRGGCCLRADHGPWYGKWKIGGLLSIQIDLQITSRVRLVVLYYINFTLRFLLNRPESRKLIYNNKKRIAWSLKKCVELLLVINLRVEILIQQGRCQFSTPSMHEVKTGVQNMYIWSVHVRRQEFLSWRSDCLTFLFAVVFR